MSIIFDRYVIQDVGKMFKDTKRTHEWTLTIKGNKVKVVVKESFVSKKFRFYYDGQLVSEFKAKEEEKKKGFDF